MIRRFVTRTAVALVGATLLAAATPAQDAPENPLAPFERFIGGQWHLDDSFQELEWGVGRRSVRARGYFVVDGKPKLVSEGVWFWHPGERRIRGFHTAVDMPVALFDYTTRFEGDTMVSELRSYSGTGKVDTYVETWALTDDRRYTWTLSRKTSDGLEKVMGGDYTRRAK